MAANSACLYNLRTSDWGQNQTIILQLQLSPELDALWQPPIDKHKST